MEAKRTFLKISLVLLAIFVGLTFLFGSQPDEVSPEAATEDVAGDVVEGTAEPKETDQKTNIKTFTAEEFMLAYDNLSHPNLTPIIEAPAITGDADADAIIQAAAEKRGYKLRQVASGLLNEIDGMPVQELLITRWLDMQQAAKEEGISINFVSGYRSVENQRRLFIERMTNSGITNDGLIAGTQTGALDGLLQITAPPGYSRHHSGYTIDVEDPGFAIFADSYAYGWMSADNFKNAKRFGFIPSYPDGLTNQGPNPEPWEFVWVGQNVTYQ